jgi:3-oxoacyl-[acyl-carrier-protein] synthase II
MPLGETGNGARLPVVVTGVGSVSALGAAGGAAVGEALQRGVSGIGAVRSFPTDRCWSRLGGEAGDVTGHLQDGETRRLARASQLAVIAARLALTDASLQPGQLAAVGLVLGSHWGDFRSSESFALGFLERGVLGLSPLVFPNTVMNAVAAQVSIAVGVRGPMLTLNEVDAAGDLAVARGAGLVASGRASAVLAGGSDELSPILYRELSRLGTMSQTEPGPEGCRPFDRRANGTVLGEGATFLVLESAEAALARGARIYAELAGAAWGNLRAPMHGFPASGGRDPVAVRRALAAAGVAADAVDLAYLTGAGHPAHDACELDLVARALPGGGARLTALTPLVGQHAGLGALRAAAAALAVAGSGVAPLSDLSEPIRQDLQFARRPTDARAESPPATALVHGLARGGTHVALLLRAFDPRGDRPRVAA